MLEAYDETGIFIPVEITEDVFKSVVRKFLGIWYLEVRTWKLYRSGF